jgi:hypothetical protein
MLSLLMVINACSGNQNLAAREPESSATSTATDAAALAPENLQVTNTVPPALDHESTPGASTLYALDVQLHTDEKQLAVQETIRYTNLTGQTLEEIVLVIPPNRQEGQFTLDSLTLSEESEPPEILLIGEQLTVFLPDPLPPEDTLEIALEYQLFLDQTPGVLGYTDRQINFCDWYAFIPPYQNPSGWQINPYHPIGETLIYEMADFEVTITLNPVDPGMVIAASTAGTTDGQHWVYQLLDARTFVWSASREYQVLSQAEYPTVSAYVLPEHVEPGWTALAATISAMNLYSTSFGAYPHESLSLVEGDFPDGMEYDGLFFVGKEYFERYAGGEKNYLTAISVHETAHQWWFAAVGNNAAQEPWLDESLSTYSELLYYETYYPGNEAWWWSFRVEPFKPAGWVNSTVYEFSSYRPYINAVYLRGAQFLQAIRDKIGDTAFKQFLKEYYRTGKGNLVNSQFFFTQLAQHSDENLSSILEMYFR